MQRHLEVKRPTDQHFIEASGGWVGGRSHSVIAARKESKAVVAMESGFHKPAPIDDLLIVVDVAVVYNDTRLVMALAMVDELRLALVLAVVDERLAWQKFMDS